MGNSKEPKPSERQKDMVQYLFSLMDQPDPVQQAVSREELCSRYGIANSSLSEDIKAINKSNNGEFTIKSQKGKVRLINNLPLLSELEEVIKYEDITDQTIGECLIMYHLKQKTGIGSTRESLITSIAVTMYELEKTDTEYYNPKMYDSDSRSDSDLLESKLGLSKAEATAFPSYALNKSLMRLRKKGYIETTRNPDDHKTLHYSLSNTYAIFEKKYSSLSKDLNNLHLYSIAKVWKPLEAMLQNYKLLPDLDAANSFSDYYVIGKKNVFDPDLIEKYNQFLKLPYKEKVLRIKYKSEKKSKEYDFETGLIYYSTETGQFYMVGKCGEKELSLRLSDVAFPIQSLPQSNKVYMDSHYRNVFKEIFQSEFESRHHHVKVRFEKLTNTEDKLYSLVSVRGEPARIQFSKDINSYIYEDTIRGLSSFARYLRAYGRSAIVSEPKQLIQIMCRSAIRTMQNYDKVWK